MPMDDLYSTKTLDIIIWAIGLVFDEILQVLFDNFLTNIWDWFVHAFFTMDPAYGVLIVICLFMVIFWWKYIPFRWGFS